MKKLIFSLMFMFVGVFVFANSEEGKEEKNTVDIEVIKHDIKLNGISNKVSLDPGDCIFYLVGPPDENGNSQVVVAVYENVADTENCNDEFQDRLWNIIFG